MGSENLAYALTQVAHNFGAIAVVGGAVFVLWPSPRLEYGRAFAWLILLGWSAQIASGAMFGVVSLYYYGETPDLSRIATAALVIKVAAAVLGVGLAARFLRRSGTWGRAGMKGAFRSLTTLGVVALTAAAFLRWFS